MIIGGFAKGNTPTSTYYDGIIDVTRIYSRALSASEVQELYNLGR